MRFVQQNRKRRSDFYYLGMAKKYIVANWKNHPDSWAEAESILNYIDEHLKGIANQESSLVVCPPFVFLEEVSRVIQLSQLTQKAELGAQDIAINDSISLTGGISGMMLVKLGARYVIIGHSERRWPRGESAGTGESNQIVNLKIKQALADGLIPIVCVGEKDRADDYIKWLKQQVGATFAGLSGDQISRCLIAYEPVWAISTNPDARPDTPESALESISAIRDFLAENHSPADVRILYGGSVTEKNAKDFLSLSEIAGVLVGGASIRKEEFVQIIKQV